jgi:hypothetical protein
MKKTLASRIVPHTQTTSSSLHETSSPEERGLRCMEALLVLHSRTGLLSLTTARAISMMTMSCNPALQHASVAFVNEIQSRGGFQLPESRAATRMGFSPSLVVGLRYSKGHCQRISALAEEVICSLDDYCNNARHLAPKQRSATIIDMVHGKKNHRTKKVWNTLTKQVEETLILHNHMYRQTVVCFVYGFTLTLPREYI